MSPSKKNAPTPRPSRRTPAPRAQEPAREAAKALNLGFEEIQSLIAQVGREPIDELQLEAAGIKLLIRKPSAAAPAAPPTPAAAVATVLAPTLPGPAPAPAAPTEPQAALAEDPGIHHITSPIVGTFYRAPSATAAPFAQPGDFVKPGQTLCIVEAMKLMNEIECDVAGEVVAVLVENGQPVEYGERLFAIRVR
jgi:acetyl-CoA carboxylase biotin carboxyl carrier protein